MRGNFLSAQTAISKVARLRRSYYIKLHQDSGVTLMFSSFKHVGGILSISAEPPPPPTPRHFFDFFTG